MIIVTNDEDFLNLINLKGFPPKVILLKTSNQSNNYIESLLIKHVQDIKLLQDILKLDCWKLFKEHVAEPRLCEEARQPVPIFRESNPIIQLL